jgi:hypothetical protein
MPYVNKPRPYAKEHRQAMARGELPDRLERQRARRELDKKGVNRKGKDVAHKKPLSQGGDNEDGYTLQSPHKNRSFPRTSTSAMKRK